MQTSSAAAKGENAEPSSDSERLNASHANPAPSEKAATWDDQEEPGRQLVDPISVGHRLLLCWVSEEWVPSRPVTSRTSPRATADRAIRRHPPHP